MRAPVRIDTLRMPVAVGLTLALLTAPFTHAQDILEGCPVHHGFASQYQHDCTVWRALKAHGGTSDHDALQQGCDGRICTYQQSPIVGKHTYSVYPYGEWVVIYPKPYYGD